MATDPLLLNAPRRVQAGRADGGAPPQWLWSGAALQDWTHRLMQATGRPQRDWVSQAGHQLAALSLALYPHARRIWVLCGPGANGLDGWHAAAVLKGWGKAVVITASQAPPPELADLAADCTTALPEQWDLAVDALYGVGLNRRIDDQDPSGSWLVHLYQSGRPMLHADLPSGLCPNTGTWLGPRVDAPRGPRHTLAMLGMSVGLWTHQGRDHAGEVWLSESPLPCPLTSTVELVKASPVAQRVHDSHKGRHGHVIVAGGQPGMQGAALLAARSALTHGAGVVHWFAPPSPESPPTPPAPTDLPTLPIQILPAWPSMLAPQDVVVAGCGAGAWDEAFWHAVLSRSPRLVLDADGLNAVARHTRLAPVLAQRLHHQQTTVITPHPLEAARMLGCSAADVQADRLQAARRLAERFQCVSVLKGSGTVISQPGGHCWINPTGNARLATAGSGDVLAGFIGALMAQGLPACQAAQHAVFEMGWMADQGSLQTHLAWTADQQALFTGPG